MSGPKFPSSFDFTRSLAANQPTASTPAPAATPTRGGSTADNAELKAAFFQQSGIPIHMRRGPIQRMPLRAPKPNRPRVPRAAGGVSNHDEESDFDIPDSEILAESRLKFHSVELRSGQEGERGDQQDGDRDESRLQKFFSMSEPSVQASKTGSTAAANAAGSRTNGLKKLEAVTLAPLPEMHSLRDVLQLIRSTSIADPSGKSLPMLLRRINAAVLQDKVSLPKITKAAEAREMLIDIFGKGHQGPSALSPTQRSLHAMLPLWLINLGRQRTPTQQTHAAARLSLPRIHDIAAV